MKGPEASQAPRGSGVKGVGRPVSEGRAQLRTLSLGCLGKRRGWWASIQLRPWETAPGGLTAPVPVTAGDSAPDTCTMTFHTQGN